MDSQKVRIARGMELLDRENPSWCDKIELKSLDVGNVGHCVLGQVYGEYIDGVGALGIAFHTERHGFMWLNSDSVMGLTRSWKKAIKERCDEA